MIYPQHNGVQPGISIGVIRRKDHDPSLVQRKPFPVTRAVNNVDVAADVICGEVELSSRMLIDSIMLDTNALRLCEGVRWVEVLLGP